METAALYVVAILLGGLGNRVRGGLWGDPIRARLAGWACLWGTGTGRAVGWGLPCFLMAWWAGMPGWWAVAVGVGAFVGCSPGNGAGISMGHRGGVTGSVAWTFMTGWGYWRILGPMLVGFVWSLVDGTDLFNPMPLVLAAFLTPVCYEAPWHFPRWAFLPGLGRTTNPENPDPPQMAEALHGAAMMVALVWAIRMGVGA